MDYSDYSVHITSPTTEVTAQDLINAIRELSATEVGIVHPTLAISSGKEPLGAGVQTALTVELLDPWQLEPYAGNYTLSISGGNIVSGRMDGDVIRYVIGGPQIEILRSAAATIVATGSGVLPTDITAIADAVWDELKAGHALTSSFGADIQASTANLDFMVECIRNRKELKKVGSVWYLIIYDEAGTTPILNKALKDVADNDIPDIAAGIFGVEIASSV